MWRFRAGGRDGPCIRLCVRRRLAGAVVSGAGDELSTLSIAIPLRLFAAIDGRGRRAHERCHGGAARVRCSDSRGRAERSVDEGANSRFRIAGARVGGSECARRADRRRAAPPGQNWRQVCAVDHRCDAVGLVGTPLRPATIARGRERAAAVRALNVINVSICEIPRISSNAEYASSCAATAGLRAGAGACMDGARDRTCP